MRARPLLPAVDLEELRDRLDLAGPEPLTTAECLALAIRRGAGRAAPGWAERLLTRFGSLPELLGASPSALSREAPPAVVRDLLVVHDLHRRALLEPLAARPVLQGFEAVADYLRVTMAVDRREQLRVLHVDKGLRLLSAECVGRGTVDHVAVYPREVVRRALELDAAGIVLAHNHPAGGTTPSSTDLDMTRQIVAAATPLRIAVHDHLLVAGQTVVSFRRLGLM
ncbi:JAB domain-containing protein [Phenylobacterium sp.]|uniref:JAB domain-containing protein n=1 Tax=Phenylobacterium sp. TaxID=1871053 RepID=UPI003BA8D632